MTFRIVLKIFDKVQWMKTVQRELNSIEQNQTWELQDLPNDGDIIDTKWTFKYKPLEEDPDLKYKARLVARGFAQNREFDYGETYSPVAISSQLSEIF